ncbi:CFEM domain-containing [Cordyceps militaris]|uniref:CFEM domain-containing n=1 Tax=Cordyceps militaris TaxID=73501 RepID=A0A2H4SNY1_CORMI|nr:CFEM domain-containing [Cordyceps militaris]
MQLNKFALALLTVAVAAQDHLDGLPECAKPCVHQNAPNSGCRSEDDFKCLCGSTEFLTAMAGCAMHQCSFGDLMTAQNWAADKC